MNRHLGLTNLYLKVGVALIVLALAVLVAAFLFPSSWTHVGSAVAGYCFLSGVVLYVMGRVVSIRRSRAQP